MSYRPKDLMDCVERYGKIQKAPDNRLYWPNDQTWIKACYLPKDISNYLKSAVSKKPVERIFCNTDIHDPLIEAMENLITSKCVEELKTFDGCYNVRLTRGSDSVVSLHSYGIAIDLNAYANPLGGRSSFSEAFVRCFTDVGWVWGGDWKKRPDPMHFQWCGNSPLIRPALNS